MNCDLNNIIGTCQYTLNDIDKLYIQKYQKDIDYSVDDLGKVIDIYTDIDWVEIEFSLATYQTDYNSTTELYTTQIVLLFSDENFQDDLNNLFDKQLLILFKDNNGISHVDGIQEDDSGYLITDFSQDFDTTTPENNTLKITMQKSSKYNVAIIDDNYISFNNL